jgi:hypothetical protein
MGTFEEYKEDGKGNKSKNELKVEEKEGWEFSGIVPTIRYGKIKKYNLSLSAGLLASMFEQGKIIYDPEFQRGEKELKTGKIVPICKMSKINEILQGMQDDIVHGNTIVLNSPISPENTLNYDPDTDTLSGTGVLAIVDGQHRIRSCHKWLKLYNKGKCINSPFDWEYPVTIENVSRIESGNIFSEYAGKSTPINKTRIEVLNTRDLSNHIIRNLIENSKLRGKVDMTSISPRNNKIVTFGYLSEGVNTFFRPQDEEQVESISSYLVEMFNKIIILFIDQMGNITIEEKAKNKKQYLTIEKMVWVSFFALFKELGGRNNVDELLAKLKNRIKVNKWEGFFLEKSNPIWQDNIMRQGNKLVSTKSTQKIMNKIVVDFTIKNEIEGYEFEVIE